MPQYVYTHHHLIAASGYHLHKQGAIHQSPNHLRFPGIIVHKRSAIPQPPKCNNRSDEQRSSQPSMEAHNSSSLS